MSTLTWDTFLTLRCTWGFYLNHVIPHRASKSYRVVGWPKILVSAPVPLELIWLGLTGLGLGLGVLGFGTGLDNLELKLVAFVKCKEITGPDCRKRFRFQLSRAQRVVCYNGLRWIPPPRPELLHFLFINLLCSRTRQRINHSDSYPLSYTISFKFG